MASFGDRKRLNHLKDQIRTKIFGEEKKDVLAILVKKERDVREASREEDVKLLNRPGLLFASDFVQVLRDCQLGLLEKDEEILVQKFGDYRGIVNTSKFARFLDLNDANDSDFSSDPSLQISRLPQPFRLIDKIIQDEIVETAWDTICQRNPSVESATKTSTAQAASAGAPEEGGEKTQTLKTHVICSGSGFEDGEDIGSEGLTTLETSPDGIWTFFGTKDGRVLAVNELDETVLHAKSAKKRCVSAFHTKNMVTHIRAFTVDYDTVAVVAAASSFHGSETDYRKGLKESDAVDNEEENDSDETKKQSVETINRWVSEEASSLLRVLLFKGGRFEFQSGLLRVNTPLVECWGTILDTQRSKNNGVTAVLCILQSQWHPCMDNVDKSEKETLSAHVYYISFDDILSPIQPQEEDENKVNETGESRLVEPSWEIKVESLAPKAQNNLGALRGFFAREGEQFFLYRQGHFAFLENSLQYQSQDTLWMSANILCHDYLKTEAGVELAAFGLQDGCCVIWNIHAKMVRATLRHHVCASTSVQFYVPDKSDTSKEDASERENMLQIVVGCSDGRLRLFQLTSDAPAAAAILPRKFNLSEIRKRKADPNEEAKERLALEATLNSSMFVGTCTSNPLTRRDLSRLDDSRFVFQFRQLENLPGSSLFVALVHVTEEATQETETELRFYDVDVNAHLGFFRLCEEENWPGSGTQLAKSGGTMRVMTNYLQRVYSFPLVYYIPCFYPSVARLLHVSPNDDKWRETAMANRADLYRKIYHLITHTNGVERCCDEEEELSKYLAGLKLTTGAKKAASPLQGLMFSPNKLALDDLPMSFSRAGMIAAMMRGHKERAKKNAMNPTRLNESLSMNDPTQRLADFEARRKSTRRDRHEYLQGLLASWAKLSKAS